MALPTQRSRRPEPKPAVADIKKAVPPPPGWYDDGKGGRRWWDGAAWTDARQAPVQQPETPNEQISGVAVLGYGLAIFTPIIGFILGLALVAKGDRHGGGVVGASLVFGFLWIALFFG